eukprot:4628407-Prymnesium_polylepis.1
MLRFHSASHAPESVAPLTPPPTAALAAAADVGPPPHRLPCFASFLPSAPAPVPGSLLPLSPVPMLYPPRTAARVRCAHPIAMRPRQASPTLHAASPQSWERYTERHWVAAACWRASLRAGGIVVVPAPREEVHMALHDGRQPRRNH